MIRSLGLAQAEPLSKEEKIQALINGMEIQFLADRAAILQAILSVYAAKTGSPSEAKSNMEKYAGSKKGNRWWDHYFKILDLAILSGGNEIQELSKLDRYIDLSSHIVLPGKKFLDDPDGRCSRQRVSQLGTLLYRSTYSTNEVFNYGDSFQSSFRGTIEPSALIPRPPLITTPTKYVAFVLRENPEARFLQKVGSPTSGTSIFGYPILCSLAFRYSYWNAENSKAYGGMARGVFESFGASKWKNAKAKILNRLVMLEAMEGYPWPAPSFEFLREWVVNFSKSEPVLDFLNSPKVHSRRDARSVLTLSIISSYNTMAARIQKEAEESAERKERKMRMLKIALAIWAAPIGFLAAPIVAAAIQAVISGVNFAQQMKAAKSMVEAAEAFQASDAAFAAELERVAAELEAGAPPEHQDAYSLVVEGVEIGTAPSVEEIAKLASENVKPGDRFEILLDGKSLGLKIMTAKGPISVPEEAVDEVVEKPPEVIRSAVKKAERGRFPWGLLLAVPVGYGILKGTS